ncbi:hypothetical protein THAOC_36736, partial [Thalassiosira oceanica]
WSTTAPEAQERRVPPAAEVFLGSLPDGRSGSTVPGPLAGPAGGPPGRRERVHPRGPGRGRPERVADEEGQGGEVPGREEREAGGLDRRGGRRRRGRAPPGGGGALLAADRQHACAVHDRGAGGGGGGGAAGGREEQGERSGGPRRRALHIAHSELY